MENCEEKLKKQNLVFKQALNKDLDKLKEILLNDNNTILSTDTYLLDAKHLIEEIIVMSYSNYIIEKQLLDNNYILNEVNMKTDKQIEKLNLEWYVLNHDFNKDKIYNFNIFSSGYLKDLIRMIKDKYYNVKDFNSLKDCVKRWANYHFHYKVEFEVEVSGIYNKNNNVTKISVYDQIEPNLNIITEYINNKLNIV